MSNHKIAPYHRSERHAAALNHQDNADGPNYLDGLNNFYVEQAKAKEARKQAQQQEAENRKKVLQDRTAVHVTLETVDSFSTEELEKKREKFQTELDNGTGYGYGQRLREQINLIDQAFLARNSQSQHVELNDQQEESYQGNVDTSTHSQTRLERLYDEQANMQKKADEQLFRIISNFNMLHQRPRQCYVTPETIGAFTVWGLNEKRKFFRAELDNIESNWNKDEPSPGRDNLREQIRLIDEELARRPSQEDQATTEADFEASSVTTTTTTESKVQAPTEEDLEVNNLTPTTTRATTQQSSSILQAMFAVILACMIAMLWMRPENT